MKIKLVQHDPNLHTIKILHRAEGVRWPRPAHTRTNGGSVAGGAPPPGPGRPSSRDAPVPASIPRLPLPGDVRRMERTHCLVPLPHSRYTCRRAKDRDNGAVKNHGKSARTCPAGRDRPPSSSTGDSGHPPTRIVRKCRPATVACSAWQAAKLDQLQPEVFEPCENAVHGGLVGEAAR
jgi:hypothetical protein